MKFLTFIFFVWFLSIRSSNQFLGRFPRERLSSCSVIRLTADSHIYVCKPTCAVITAIPKLEDITVSFVGFLLVLFGLLSKHIL